MLLSPAVQHRAVPILLIALLFGSWLAAFVTALWWARSDTLNNGMALTRTHARNFEEHLTQSLRLIDFTASSLSLDVQGGTYRDMDRHLASIVQPEPFLRSLSVVDDAGWVHASSSAGNVGARVSLQDFFPETMLGADILRIGLPWRGRDLADARPAESHTPLSPQDSTIVPLLHHLPGPGNLSLLAVINPDYFANHAEQLLAGAAGHVQWLRYDDVLLMSSSRDEAPATRGSAGWVTQRIAVQEHGEQAQVLGHGGNGREVLTAYRSSARYPVLVAVHLDRGAVLDAWKTESLWLMAIVIPALLSLAGVIAWIWRRKRHADRELAEQRQLLKSLVHGLPDLVCFKDVNGIYLACNARFERFFGATEADIIGKTDHEFVEKELADFFRAHDKAAMENGGPTRNEEWVNFASDQHRELLETTRSPVFDAGGRLIGVLGVGHDITARRQAEEIVIEERAVRDTITDSIPGVFYALDSAGRFLFWNNSMEEVSGYGPLELSGMSAFDLFDEAGRERVRNGIVATFAMGQASIEANLISRSGRQVAYLFTGKRIELVGQTLLVGVGMDISERKAAEAAVIEAMQQAAAANRERSLLSKAVEQSSASVVITDAHGEIVFVNRAFEEISGYGLGDVRGKNPSVFKSGLTSASTYNDLWQSINHGNTWKGELLNRYRNGELHWESVTISPVTDEQGVITNFIAVKDDITEKIHKQVELVQARDAADAANHAKSRFLATMSHEIRTPMNGILGMAQLLLMPDISAADRQNYVQTIYRAGYSLLKLLNEILDLSKLEAGRVELELVAFQPAQLVQEVTMFFSEQVVRKGLAIDMRVTIPAAQRVQGDVTRVRQVLINLVGNAVKFTEKGSIQLNVMPCEALAVAAGGDSSVRNEICLRFEVHDSGIGLSESQREALFQPFSQADASVTRRYGGTGLGLAISRNLVELMGGRIGVVSTPGQGSVFWFEVPLGPVCPESEVSVAPRLPSGDILPASGLVARPRHILVVEDVPTNRLIVTDYLTRRGYTVATVENGVEALTWLRNHATPDLVLMDCQMPEMDGFEATRHIRAMQTVAADGRRLPILALTADVLEESRCHCLAAGMDDFLAKPLSFRDLNVALGKWLPDNEVLQPATTPPLQPPAVQATADIPLLSLEIQADLSELDQLLTQQLMTARRVARRINAALPAGYWPQRFKAVMDAIDRMDYQTARTCLGEFIAKPSCPP